jgi:hypothetical protein
VACEVDRDYVARLGWAVFHRNQFCVTLTQALNRVDIFVAYLYTRLVSEAF